MEDVVEITGYSRSWIYELVWGYNRIGPETLGDGRQDNPGAEVILDDVQQANLWQALKGPAPLNFKGDYENVGSDQAHSLGKLNNKVSSLKAITWNSLSLLSPS